MAGLTKQHFNKIAEIINKHITYEGMPPYDSDIILSPKDIIKDLSDYFKTQNPLFNENQFKKACLK